MDCIAGKKREMRRSKIIKGRWRPQKKYSEAIRHSFN